MKGFQVSAPHAYAVVDTAEVAPDVDEVRVTVAHAGICGSDMHIIHGDNAFVRYPRITGHEFAGTVTAVGANVDTARVGQRVCVDPVISCGRCYPCRIGRPNVCTHLEVIGVHRDGGFQTQVAIPAANAHVLPESLSLEAGALVEPYSIAANVLARMAPQPGDRLLIFGAGVIGLTVLQMARALGIEEVAVTDIIDARLEAARALGAARVVNGRQQDIEAFASEWTDGEGVPLVADAACVPALLAPMVRLASPAGRIGLLGFSAAASDLVQLEVIRKELTLLGSRLNNQRFPQVLELIESGRLDPAALVSHRLPIADMVEAIDLIERTPEQTRKVLIDVASSAN